MVGAEQVAGLLVGQQDLDGTVDPDEQLALAGGDGTQHLRVVAEEDDLALVALHRLGRLAQHQRLQRVGGRERLGLQLVELVDCVGQRLEEVRGRLVEGLRSGVPCQVLVDRVPLLRGQDL